MQKKVSLLIILFLPSALFAQLHFGLNFGLGYNKELYYNKYSSLSFFQYKLSYKGGIFCNYSLTKKIGVSAELNYFKLRTYFTHFNLMITYHYLETPIYIDYAFGKMKVGLGAINNFNIKPNDLKKVYTVGLIAALYYQISNKIGLQLRYSRELTHNNVFLFGGAPYEQRLYNQNFTLNVFFRLK